MYLIIAPCLDDVGSAKGIQHTKSTATVTKSLGTIPVPFEKQAS